MENLDDAGRSAAGQMAQADARRVLVGEKVQASGLK
jgi:hypothetical protein